MPRPLWALLGVALGVVLGAAVARAEYRALEPTITFDADDESGDIVDVGHSGDDGPGFFAPAR